jgi:hypothetical protein
MYIRYDVLKVCAKVRPASGSSKMRCARTTEPVLLGASARLDDVWAIAARESATAARDRCDAAVGQFFRLENSDLSHTPQNIHAATFTFSSPSRIIDASVNAAAANHTPLRSVDWSPSL